MSCSACRQSPVYRRPSSTPTGNGGIVLPTPTRVNNTSAPHTGDARSKITNLKYVPK